MNESRFIEYPNAWCPLTDPHQAMLEAVITLGFAKDAIERTNEHVCSWTRARIAISALEWIVNHLELHFSEDWEAHCAGRQELAAKVLADQAMDEDAFVQAGIAAREAIKNIKQQPTAVMVEEHDEEPKSMSEQIVHAQNTKTNEQ